MGQSAKFSGLPQQNCPDSAAYCSLAFVSKPSSILLKDFSYWRLALCSFMLGCRSKKIINLFLHFKSALCQVALCLYTIVVHCDGYYLLVGLEPTDFGSSVRFFHNIFCLFNYVIKLIIILIISHFSTFAKFSEVLWKYQNSAEKGRFRSSTQNYAAYRKLWALLIIYTFTQRGTCWLSE